MGGLDTGMTEHVPASRAGEYLATAFATRREKRLALAIAAICFAAFVATAPFVRVPQAPMPAFIPSYEAALFFIDLTTSVLLFDQFARLRSAGILVLASGYLFDALIIVAHALSFPGAFATTGLLGAKEQTTAWLYVFWHGGFPLFVIGYAVMRRDDASEESYRPTVPAGATIMTAIAAVGLLTAALTLFATWGHDWLPIVMRGSDYSLLVKKGVSPAVWGLTLIALVALWRRKQRVVDLWLMLVMWIWLFDIALSAVVGSARYDLGFYAGRIFGLIASSFLLITLVVRMAQMYAGALSAVASAEHRFEELSRLRGRSQTTQPESARNEPEGKFISRQNIARYRSMLETMSIDDAQRGSIERLLAEEEAKYRSSKTENQ